MNEKVQLGKVVSLSKGLECHFHAENEKSIFHLKKSTFHGFYRGIGSKTLKEKNLGEKKFFGEKIKRKVTK